MREGWDNKVLMVAPLYVRGVTMFGGNISEAGERESFS
jgi:hypothetical protein